MLRLFDFYCHECGSTEEHLIDDKVREVTCQCGSQMKRVISPVRFDLDGTDPSFPGAYAQWPKKWKSRVEYDRKRKGYDPKLSPSNPKQGREGV